MRDLLFKKGRAYEFRKRHFLALPMMYNLSNEDNSRQKFVKCSPNVCNSFCIFHELISILYDNNYMKMFLKYLRSLPVLRLFKWHFFLIIKYHQLN